MSWWKDFWKKPASAGGHFAWGFMVAAIAVRLGASDTLAVALSGAAGIVWEVGGEGIACFFSKTTARAWYARAWDVTPWLLGGFALALTWWITK